MYQHRLPAGAAYHDVIGHCWLAGHSGARLMVIDLFIIFRVTVIVKIMSLLSTILILSQSLLVVYELP